MMLRGYCSVKYIEKNKKNTKNRTMRLDQLNFNHLFYFWRVAKLGHLTQAAQELHTSQSAVSTQIRQLEERLGEELFLREGRRLLLTDTGQLVLAYAENIFGLGQEMLGRLQGSASGVTRLRVGSVATLSRNYQENWIRPLLADPSVVLTLESGLLEGLITRLVQHQLDVVLANESVPSDSERPLHCQFLGSQSISLVGPASVWQSRSLRIPEDLEGMEVALPGPRHALRAQFDVAVQRFIERLRSDPDWERKGEEIRTWLQTDATVGGYVQAVWLDLRGARQRDLADADSVLARQVGKLGLWLGESLAGDAALRQSFNDRLERWVEGLAPDVSAFIAQHIEDTVRRWDAEQMTQLIELNIGKDLQYIRINGTVVGGLIGLVLFGVSHAGEIWRAVVGG